MNIFATEMGTKIISGLASGDLFRMWCQVITQDVSHWCASQSAQDGLQVSLRDLEHVPRWVNWYSALSLWTLKVDFMACFASLPSSLKNKKQKQKNLWSKVSFVLDPPETAEWLVVQFALHSVLGLSSPEWPSVTTRELKGRILEGYLKTPAHDSSSQREPRDLWQKVRTVCQALHANNKYYFCS